MNFNSLKFAIRLVTICIIIVILLIGCSTPYHPAAPISSIHDTKYMINTDSIINTSAKSAPIASFPKNISVNNQNRIINKALYYHQPVMPIFNLNANNRIIYNRNYENIQKGSYSSDTYTVKRGDTLFYIAWITGNNYRDLARWNKIPKPYTLNVGKVLNISNYSSNLGIMVLNHTQNINTNSQLTSTYTLPVVDRNSGKMLLRATNPSTSPASSAKTVSPLFNSNSVVNTIGKWHWPAEGKIIEFFSDMQGGNKGVDIAGSRGQPIFATAAGKVVYSGNALRGYGNLVIIKHKDDYLSAYAHNDTVLVRDQQEVHAGQKIATMGSTGTNFVKLHFEIRHKGKSVNPLLYISQQ